MAVDLAQRTLSLGCQEREALQASCAALAIEDWLETAKFGLDIVVNSVKAKQRLLLCQAHQGWHIDEPPDTR